MSLALLVHAWGHQAHVARDFEDVKQQAADICPDVVFLDIAWPGPKGWDVVRRLRLLPTLSQTYFVAITSWTQEDDHAQAVGCDRYFIKPANPSELQEILSIVKRNF